MKIAFLINNAYGIGGTIRSTANLSRAFAARHDVEVVSVHQVKDAPELPFDERVGLSSLIDMREDSSTYEGDHPLTRQPCTMFPDTGAAANSARLPYSALQDERIGRWLSETNADVVIATRPDLNGYLARDGQARHLRIGQEHLSLDAHNPTLRGHQNKAVAGLDAFVTVSEADAVQYRRALPNVAARILCIPNSVPAPAVEPSDHHSQIIIAAGRLATVKRYDRLIDAFAKLADAHPAWTLRLYGRGPERPNLRRQIDELGLYDRISLMGPVSPIETEWAKGAIAAVSSDMESFGMTIVEAMHCGVPVVSTDCPHGPAEIIDETNGMLVPLEAGVDGYAAALDRLMADAQLRARLGATARERARAYTPSVIARRYEALFEELSAPRNRRRPAGARGALWTRLRSALPTRLTPRADPSPAPAPRPATPEPIARPVAFAQATADGGISIRLDAASLPPGPLDFLARLRRDPKKRHIRVPLPPVATTPDPDDPRITLDPTEHTLAEGRWDCYVVPQHTADDKARLLCALAEQVHSVGRAPNLADGNVSAWLPYTTTDGYLALRTWQRPAHAEVTAIAIGDHHATVTAQLYATDAPRIPHTATIVAVSRQGEPYDFTLPLTQPATAPGHFTFTLPYSRALSLRCSAHDIWDLRLRLEHTSAPIPLGRIGGDIVDRKKTDAVPAVDLRHEARGETRAKPFFTVTNDLALSLRDTEDQAQRTAT
ncbi:glycosyltransferase family 4 protein [Streptomyces flavofungini]|uniref:glycosyltransferase family 4 protein n=1 Tax=Streptomyces flavofungini TaxID=68200 RepID=UPI0025AFCF15|nr:glycosyltransferase family 4 protein [Streptomyces flavofungini]WJV48669.1 glycosyltransferase family 4 protein [Streptomyces flavofungini]